MTWETLMVYVISMVFGLGAGILFSKLAELLAVKIVQGGELRLKAPEG